MRKTIIVRLDFESSLNLSCQLAEATSYKEVTFDFSSIQRVEPFALLMVSSQIKRFQDIRGVNSGRTYIPIEILNCQSIVDSAFDNGHEVGDEIESKCRKMAQVLSSSSQGDLYDYLTYSFRELLRNVIEHSESTQVGYCAQFWPTRQRVELAIIDRGMGLRNSLKNNPYIDTRNDKTSINYALMPAVSGKAYKGAKKQSGNWQNSGFGLYMTNRICRNGGSFFIASGETGMLLTDVGEAKKYYDCNFEGTAVRMIIKTEKIGKLSSSLSKYRDEGFEVQKQYKELVRIDPSAASLMLSEDFHETFIEKILNKIKNNS